MSGLGLAAQKESVRLYSKSRKIKLAKEYTEIESGKKSKRPVLKEALEYCKANKLLLIIAKLDRLGRNVVFISTLMESNVEFVAVDNPEANHLVLHILAAFAQYEREQISIRTKAALNAARRRGVKLGKFSKILAKRNSKRSRSFAKKMKPIILKLKKQGFTSLQKISDELNRRKIPTYRIDSKWHKSTVHNLLNTIKKTT
ncbi:recombinase family protein [Ferruginibacter albus]|uniref:recombinase family protein n=1 Tax=Ferruginibacter albus TaxID=2875540 RepID=UPI001CC7D302|nr:recombinase family protein [Ferruginibacter albus]UAY53213.1 recombinase family protein [Ferruginibacter albus]